MPSFHVQRISLIQFLCFSSYSLAARYATQSNHSGIATSQKKPTRSVNISNVLLNSDNKCPMILCPIILMFLKNYILLDEKFRGPNSSKRLFLCSLLDEHDGVRSLKWDVAASNLGLSYIYYTISGLKSSSQA